MGPTLGLIFFCKNSGNFVNIKTMRYCLLKNYVKRDMIYEVFSIIKRKGGKFLVSLLVFLLEELKKEKEK